MRTLVQSRPVHSRPRRMRAVAGAAVALAAAAFTVAFGTPASATETPPGPSTSASPPAAEQPPPPPAPPAAPPEAPKPVEKATLPVDPSGEDQFTQEGTARISGVVWDDKNRDGIRDTGESPLADAVVLIEPINDGELPQKTKLDALSKAGGMPRGLLVRSPAYLGVKTGTDGRYTFEKLPSVPVRLWVVGPKATDAAVWRVSPKGKGNDRKLDSDFTEITVDLPGLPAPLYIGKSDRQQLEAEQSLTLDAGLFLKKPSGSISGRVWNDRNRNGIQDKGEQGVKGLPVVAFAERRLKVSESFRRLSENVSSAAPISTGPAFHMTTTDDKGEYSFPEVLPGTWLVAVGAGPLGPDGRDIPVIVWTFTQKDAGGDDTKDSDVQLSPRLQNKAAISDPVTIERDAKVDIDAGVFRDEPSASPSASPSTEPSASAEPPPAPGTGGGKLPKTGLAIGGFLLAGAVLIGGGTVLTLAARKRRPTP